MSVIVTATIPFNRHKKQNTQSYVSFWMFARQGPDRTKASTWSSMPHANFFYMWSIQLHYLFKSTLPYLKYFIDEDAYSHEFLTRRRQEKVSKAREAKWVLGALGCRKVNDELGFMVTIRILFELFLSFLSRVCINFLFAFKLDKSRWTT